MFKFRLFITEMADHHDNRIPNKNNNGLGEDGDVNTGEEELQQDKKA